MQITPNLKRKWTLTPTRCGTWHTRFGNMRNSAWRSSVVPRPPLPFPIEKHGFAISDRGIGGLDTSWIGTWSQGDGGPTIGILRRVQRACPVLETTRSRRKRLRPMATPTAMAAATI